MRPSIQISLGFMLVFLFGSPLVSEESFAADAPKTAAAKPKAVASKPKVINLPKFNGINLSGIGDLYIKQTADEGVTVGADDSLLPLIKVEVHDKILYLDVKNSSQHTQEKLNLMSM